MGEIMYGDLAQIECRTLMKSQIEFAILLSHNRILYEYGLGTPAIDCGDYFAFF